MNGEDIVSVENLRPEEEQEEKDESEELKLKLRRDLILMKRSYYGMPGTDGTRESNMYTWVMNSHPFLSLFFADPDHPIKRQHRWLIFISLNSLSFFMAAALEPDANTSGDRTIFAILISIMLNVYETFLILFIGCPCLHRSKGCLKNTTNFFRCVFALPVLTLTISFIAVGSSYLTDEVAGDDFFGVWLGGQFSSYMTWFLIKIPLYLRGYEKAKQEFREKYPGLLNIDGDLEEMTEEEGMTEEEEEDIEKQEQEEQEGQEEQEEQEEDNIDENDLSVDGEDDDIENQSGEITGIEMGSTA